MKTDNRLLFPQFKLAPQGADWHPIPFTDALVLKTRARLKTVTRRPLRKQPPAAFLDSDADVAPLINGTGTRWALGYIKGAARDAWPSGPGFKCPYGRIGDVLWEREAHRFDTAHSCGEGGCECEDVKITYRADGAVGHPPYPEDFGFSGIMRPPMFMHRWACRTLLRVTSIDLERLQAITELDAAAEGLDFDGTYWLGSAHPVKGTRKVFPSARQAFADIWNSIYGLGAWEDNKFVWRIQFDLLEAL